MKIITTFNIYLDDDEPWESVNTYYHRYCDTQDFINADKAVVIYPDGREVQLK